MAYYRNISMSFWTDPKIADDFTPEDKYLYLYLMTNPHTKLCGCYEISFKQMADETGYTKDRVEKLISHLEKEHKVVAYSKETKEVLLFNWHRYNWTSSEKFRIPLGKEIQSVKNAEFKSFLADLYNGIDTVSIRYPYSSDTTVTVTDTVTDSDTVSAIEKNAKHKYGEYQHVLLTDKQYQKLIEDFGEKRTLNGIKKVDEYCEQYGKRYSNYNLTLRKWGIEKEDSKSSQSNDVIDMWQKAFEESEARHNDQG